MRYYCAPLEGITGHCFRRAHHRFFPGADAYYTPFVVATYTNKLKSREKLDVLPENNCGVPTVPQVLTNRPEEFLHCAGFLAEFGYTEVNINLGCPVGTVTAKGKGSGMLRTPEVMDRFLDAVFEGAEKISVTDADGNRGPLHISVKTRLGWEDPAEFDGLLAVYRRYPLEKLVVHARTREELYRGKPELETFAAAYRAVGGELRLCYNGDVRNGEDLDALEKAFPSLDGIMTGRGLLSDPGMITERVYGIRPGKKTLQEFHDTLYRDYGEQFRDDRIRINCMKELWTFLGESFRDDGRYVKGIHKAKNRIEYESAVRMLFANCERKPLESGIADAADAADVADAQRRSGTDPKEGRQPIQERKDSTP